MGAGAERAYLYVSTALGFMAVDPAQPLADVHAAQGERLVSLGAPATLDYRAIDRMLWFGLNCLRMVITSIRLVESCLPQCLLQQAWGASTPRVGVETRFLGVETESAWNRNPNRGRCPRCAGTPPRSTRYLPHIP